jgi:hypothetical protein
MIIDTQREKFLLVTFVDNQFVALSIEGQPMSKIIESMNAIKTSNYISCGRTVYPSSSIVKFVFSSTKVGSALMYENVNELILD